MRGGQSGRTLRVHAEDLLRGHGRRSPGLFWTVCTEGNRFGVKVERAPNETRTRSLPKPRPKLSSVTLSLLYPYPLLRAMVSSSSSTPAPVGVDDVLLSGSSLAVASAIKLAETDQNGLFLIQDVPANSKGTSLHAVRL